MHKTWWKEAVVHQIYWRNDVKVAVTTSDNQLLYKSLEEVQPFHWSKAYQDLHN